MGDIDKLFEIIEQISYSVLVEKVDCIWTTDGYEISWNRDDNKDDLVVGDGNTYSGEIREGFRHYNGYFVCNVDCGCGAMVTMFFNLEKKV